MERSVERSVRLPPELLTRNEDARPRPVERLHLALLLRSVMVSNDTPKGSQLEMAGRRGLAGVDENRTRENSLVRR